MYTQPSICDLNGRVRTCNVAFGSNDGIPHWWEASRKKYFGFFSNIFYLNRLDVGRPKPVPIT